MPQYLLSIYQPDGDPPPPEVLNPIMENVRAWNADLRAAGAWVFTGRLYPASTATVVRDRDGGPVITAVHSDAPDTAATDWAQIVALYDQLLTVAPSPVVALHRAVAVAEVDGPAAALALVDRLDLASYYLFHAIRGHLLRQLGRTAAAAAAYQQALDRAGNAAERDFLRGRLRELSSEG